MTEKSQQLSPKVPDLGIWKTVGPFVQYRLWQAHSAFAEAIMHLEVQDGKYVEQIERLRKLRNETKEIIEAVGTFEET